MLPATTIQMKRFKTIALLGVTAGFWCAVGVADERLADARAAVTQWVEVERTISREAFDWEDKQRLLTDLVAVARSQVESLKKEIAEANKASGLAESRRAELVSKRNDNAELSAIVEKFLVEVEGRLRGMKSRFPGPLADKLAPLTRRLPDDSAKTELGVGARMQTVMGFIAEIQRFDTMVSVGEELLEFEGREPREVRTIHFGLGASFFVAADGSDAGVGRSTADGWTWESRPALAAVVTEAIATAEGRSREARFLALPVVTKEVAK